MLVKVGESVKKDKTRFVKVSDMTEEQKNIVLDEEKREKIKKQQPIELAEVKI